MRVIILKNCWTTSIQYIKGVGPSRTSLLARLGIFTIGDLLEYYPRRYEDRSQLKKINALLDGQLESFRGKIMSVAENKPRRGLTITKVSVSDGSGIAKLVWFNQPHMKKKYQPGLEVLVSGKVKSYYQIEISNPQIEIINDDEVINTRHIVPVYPANETINQRYLRKLISQVLVDYQDIEEILPATIIQQFSLLDRRQAFDNIHSPQNMNVLEQARRRLVFEELYLLQCGLLFLKKQHRSNHVGIKHGIDGTLSIQAKQQLPFTLTDDQQQV